MKEILTQNENREIIEDSSVEKEGDIELLEEYRLYLEKLNKVKAEIGKRYGPDSIEDIEEQIKTGKGVESISKKLERRTSLEEARQIAFEKLS